MKLDVKLGDKLKSKADGLIYTVFSGEDPLIFLTVICIVSDGPFYFLLQGGVQWVVAEESLFYYYTKVDSESVGT